MPLSISPLKSHAALLVSQLQFYIYPISRNKSIARLLLEHDFLDSFIENNEKILSPLWQLLHQNNDLFSLYFEALFVILIKNHVYSSDRDSHEIHIWRIRLPSAFSARNYFKKRNMVFCFFELLNVRKCQMPMLN